MASQTSPSPKLSLRATLGRLTILSIAAALRFHRIDAHSLWIDEISTYLSVTGTQFHGYVTVPRNVLLTNPPPLTDANHAVPWWQVLKPDRDDVHPPVYFFLLRLWSEIFGWSAIAFRSFSVAASLLAIAMLFSAVRQWSGTGAGLAAAAIMAAAEPQLRMAQEARSYTLVLAVAGAALWLIALIEQRGLSRWRVAILSLLCLLLPFLHYFTLVIVISLAAYASIRFAGKTRVVTLAAMSGSALLFLLIWFPVLKLQADGASGAGTTVFVDGEPSHLLATLSRLALLTMRCLYEPLPSAAAVSMITSGLVFFAAIMLRRRRELLIWVIWIPINILPALLVDLTHRSWTLQISRYTLPASLGVYALLASLTTHLALRWRYLLPGIAVAGCLLHLNQAYYPEDSFSLSKWRELAGLYRQMARPGDITLFAADSDRQTDFAHYLCVDHYVESYPGPIALINRSPDADLLAEIRRHPRIILVGSWDAASNYFPQAHIVDRKAIYYLGCVTVLTFPEVPPPTTSGSTSHTPPKSQATSIPAR